MKDMSKEQLEAMLVQYRTASKIAKVLEINVKTVYRNLKKNGIATSIGSQGARKHIFNERYFLNIDTSEKAYWLGFIMADGCIYQGSNKDSLRLQINLKSSDIEHLQKFQKCIKSDYNIQVKPVGNGEAALLKINSTIMCKDLMDHNVISRKSLICEYPDILEEFNSHYARGYFDGDGCITQSKLGKWKMCIVGGENMLLSLQDTFPIVTHIYRMKYSEAVSLETSCRQSIEDFKSYLYKDSTICLDRKKDKFEKFTCPVL